MANFCNFCGKGLDLHEVTADCHRCGGGARDDDFDGEMGNGGSRAVRKDNALAWMVSKMPEIEQQRAAIAAWFVWAQKQDFGLRPNGKKRRASHRRGLQARFAAVGAWLATGELSRSQALNFRSQLVKMKLFSI